jgi:CxxC-x17-CxxC domain-containing protein
MGDFKKRFGSHSGGGGGFGGRSGGGRGFGGGGFDRNRGPVTMHQAVCDQCGKPCEVPFRPTGEKPVYCNTCFAGKKEMGDNRGGDRFSQSPRPNFGNASAAKGGNDRQLEMLNAKMDRLVRAVEIMAKIKPLAEEGKAKEAVKKTPAVKSKKSAKKSFGK